MKLLILLAVVALAGCERERSTQVREIENCFRNGGTYVSGPYRDGQRYIGCAGKPSDFVESE